jgi:hypothetical protein
LPKRQRQWNGTSYSRKHGESLPSSEIVRWATRSDGDGRARNHANLTRRGRRLSRSAGFFSRRGQPFGDQGPGIEGSQGPTDDALWVVR